MDPVVTDPLNVKGFPTEDTLTHFYTATAAAMTWPAPEFSFGFQSGRSMEPLLRAHDEEAPHGRNTWESQGVAASQSLLWSFR